MEEYQKALGSQTISKLLVKQSTPAFLGVIVMCLYNIADTIFIGKGVGTLGIAGIEIAFPVQMIIMAVAQMIGIGSASIISRSLGAKDKHKAENTLGNSFFLIIIFSLAVAGLGTFFIDPLLKLFGATENILPYARDYLKVIILGTGFVGLAVSDNSIIRAEGNAKYAMFVMMLSAGINVIMDPLFIFTLGMGVQGAALATVIAQGIAACATLHYFLSGKSALQLKLRDLKPKTDIMKETLAIGSSSFARQMSTSTITVIVNHSLGIYGGDITIAAYGVINRIMMLVLAPMFAIVQGLQPILGYNYGARKYGRSMDTITVSIKFATAFSIIAFAGIMLFSDRLFYIFSSDPELINIGSYAVRIILLMLPIIGFQVVAGGVYQAVGKAKPAFILSILRQIVFLTPLIVSLPFFYKLDGVWLAFPSADLLAGAFTFMLIKKEINGLKEKS